MSMRSTSTTGPTPTAARTSLRNGVADRIEPMLGDVRRIAGRHYGFILANINRNILTADMPAYAAALEPAAIW